MAAQQVSISREAVVRLADTELLDLNAAIRNALDEAYLDWPNEAGFSNLDEHRGPIELPIRGRIPSWAAGSLFRTGPGANKIDNTSNGTLHISHWFDGLAHIHRFDIIAGIDGVEARVFYSSRRQCDRFIEHAQKSGIHDLITFAQRSDPCIGLFSKIASAWMVAQPGRETKKVENVGVTVQLDVPGLAPATRSEAQPQKTVWLGTDCHLLREVDGHTLEPISFAQQDDIHPELDGQLSCAHVQRCPTTGDYFNININAGHPATYKVFRVSAATGETEILATINRSDVPMAYIHSFFLSQHFVVLRVPSSHIALDGISILWKRNVMDAMKPFDKSKKNKWFIIDRLRGRGVVAEFETEAAFFFHTVNCFDKMYLDREDDVGKWSISCDTIEYPNMNILRSLYYEVLLNQDYKARAIWGIEDKVRDTLPRLTRWKFTLPLHHPIPPQVPPSRVSKLHHRLKAVTEGLGRKLRETADTVVAVVGAFSSVVLSLLRPELTFQQVPLEEGLQEDRNDEQRFQATTSTFSHGKEVFMPESASSINIPSPHVGELPTINPAYHTRPYRYVYSLAMSGRSTLVDTIVKTNLVSRVVLQWNNPLGHTPGEAIFVQRPGGVKEDDGVLLSVVLDGFNKTSYLLCLDAWTMCEMGRAEMDFAVGFGFHGVHAPDIPATTTSESSGESEEK
ncbi:hypothetical protein N8I77_002247 [Diaporthe amygdali]|uniref:Carotenoid oxygenase n=1 Tax=Phomopsis amygdali TaxID=1214568 RepID=A0AAD9W8X0_PHOAM|nr:hypothetical protein N8I77_002247 [Diaporthe amygdali]